jgi:hypothetical protein
MPLSPEDALEQTIKDRRSRTFVALFVAFAAIAAAYAAASAAIDKFGDAASAAGDKLGDAKGKYQILLTGEQAGTRTVVKLNTNNGQSWVLSREQDKWVPIQ